MGEKDLLTSQRDFLTGTRYRNMHAVLSFGKHITKHVLRRLNINTGPGKLKIGHCLRVPSLSNLDKLSPLDTEAYNSAYRMHPAIEFKTTGIFCCVQDIFESFQEYGDLIDSGRGGGNSAPQVGLVSGISPMTQALVLAHLNM